MKILILNGPNLNRLGMRKPDIYGTKTMAQILLDIQRAYPDVYFEYYQSNHEGDLIDKIQETNDEWRMLTDEWAGIVLNAGGYSHTSVTLRDAVEECDMPVVEVHISDISQREEFRRVSLLTPVCAHSIIGKGTDGYQTAVAWIINETNN